MTTLKVIEVMAQSDKSWEDAARTAVAEVSKTMKNVRSIYIEHMEATVADGKIRYFRINGKVSFEIDGNR